tara:strand:+ start:13912 stop:15051 length:1140 start_codon:yes stop_codon:yes gene_type:complete
MSTLKVDNLNGSTGSTVNVPSGQTLFADTLKTDNIQVTDNNITTYTSNSNINITPNGSGAVVIDGLSFPTSDGSNQQVLQTDGSGNLSFATISVSSTSISQLNTNVTCADTGTNGTVTIQCDGNTEMTVTDDGVRVHGNLTIDGTQTIVNTTTLSVEDNIIEVNRNVSSNAGMPTYSGLKVNRGSASTATEQDLFFVWDESFADDGTTTFGNAGGAWTAFKSANDPLTAATLVDIRANIVHAVATGAQYSDVAERYAADESMPCGTVVEIGGEQEITTAKGEMSENVFGVVSTQPAFMMNASAGNNDSHPFVAMVGRVPVRVIGTANKGDRLVMSEIDGVARTLKDGETAKTERVIGRVLQNKIVNDEHTIECVVQCRV